MKKIILPSQARVGMYVDSLGKDWMKHNYLRSCFLIKNEAMLTKLQSSQLKEIAIDTDKGLDVEEKKPDAPKPKQKPVEKPVTPAFPQTTGADIQQAKMAYKMASQVIQDLMNDVRSGKALKPEQAASSAEQIIKSIDSSPHTLIAVTRIKTRDEYTFQHSVGVATLLAGFAKETYSKPEIEEITIGGIIHDIGKIKVPDSILNKPNKLEDDEFVIMKKHVTYSREILEEFNYFTRMQIDIALLHHERPDGRGYPLGLKAEDISEIGAMGAIIDVYDALSTRRVYKKAWEPSQALKSMLEWGPGQFNQPLLLRFIKYLGVYPVGTWVLLKSNHVGFVLSQNEGKLRPVVQIILEVKTRRLMNQEVDLSAVTSDAIKGVVSPQAYGLNDDFVI